MPVELLIAHNPDPQDPCVRRTRYPTNFDAPLPDEVLVDFGL